MRFIPTWMHGMLDYLIVGAMFAVPRVLGWDKRATTVLNVAAGGALGYSLFTRYELGIFKLLPMPVHLALDATSGATLCAAPFFLPVKKKQHNAITTGFLMFGLVEIAAALFTKTQPDFVGEDLVTLGQRATESLQETIA